MFDKILLFHFSDCLVAIMIGDAVKHFFRRWRHQDSKRMRLIFMSYLLLEKLLIISLHYQIVLDTWDILIDTVVYGYE